MATYFFNLVSDEGLVPDSEGSDLPSLNAAREEARLALVDLLWKRNRHSRNRPQAFEITDGSGHVVAYVPIAEAF